MSRAGLVSFTRVMLGAAATAVYLLPLFWMVSTSLKPQDQIIQKPPVLFPASPQVESYRSVLGLPTGRPDLYINTAVYFKNSLVIASATTLLTLALAVPAAYALSRFRFRGQ